MKTRFDLFKTFSLLLFFCFFHNQDCQAQILHFQFANPEINYEEEELCYDAEIQAEEENAFLDEINIRMFISKATITFKDLREPHPEYFFQTGGESIETIQGSGPSFFGFEDEAIYIYDNFKSINQDLNDEKLIAQSPNWTYLFKTCFNPVDPAVFYSNSGQICPPIVWDQFNILTASDGIQALLLNPNGGPGLAVDEQVTHANWENFEINTELGPCADALTSTQEVHKDDLVEINLTPNPTWDHLNIRSSQANVNVKAIEIYDAQGKRVILRQDDINLSTSSDYNINVSALSPGVYFLKLSNQSVFQTKRFVKL